ncbi:MAG: radical SAM protein [Thermoanaerobacteraceae bacterium]|uniref:radical SAM protein n=1 Tax=Thermanaeromonas sp. C210 TaxID=2731925 RepID=UPI00155D072F|nr:radical SAM protein [Thermanaeromonas sp. C210]MBE3582313.1 radical SAM protein [Thermoanaerobacteraceae bacterium]GFN23809.1 radical SAM protein [Thermanaeromonas sp. C210]
MIIDICPETLPRIRNPVLAKYAGTYLQIYEDFLHQVRRTGIEIAEDNWQEETKNRIENLRRKGVVVRNDAKSLYINRISPACLACRKGVGSLTLFLSLQCHRRCFFCFNPNQENYDYYSQNKRDCLRELDYLQRAGQEITHLALTGGEPLLHPAEMLAFFRAAKEKFPGVYTRLYTAGDLADRHMLAALQGAGLDEIRFSIRLHDPEGVRQRTFKHIALARDYIPRVMVEMPVLPGTVPEMQGILLELERLNIFGINLLEFCYPFNNADVYREKGYKIKNPPYRVLYNYWYGGGLPVAGSELDCLELMDFALEQGLKIGIHYCSLENKNTSQIYRQNYGHGAAPFLHFSPRDYFIKSAKVFGGDIPRVLRVFKKRNYRWYNLNKTFQFLEFHVNQVKELKGLEVEVGISTSVMEEREDGSYLRELKIQLTWPEIFDPAADV